MILYESIKLEECESEDLTGNVKYNTCIDKYSNYSINIRKSRLDWHSSEPFAYYIASSNNLLIMC